MTLQEKTIFKIRQLPDNLVKQVNDFVDFLVMDEDQDDIWSLWEQFSTVAAGSGIKFSDYSVDEEDLENADQ